MGDEVTPMEGLERTADILRGKVDPWNTEKKHEDKEDREDKGNDDAENNVNVTVHVDQS